MGRLAILERLASFSIRLFVSHGKTNYSSSLQLKLGLQWYFTAAQNFRDGILQAQQLWMVFF
jgi:hypothetical protein